MARRSIRKATRTEDAGYPSLKQHLLSRRRFLELAGTSVAAAGLLAACGRAMGVGDPDGGTDPDADMDAGEQEVDADIEIGGVVAETDYYILRIPDTGDLYAYLVDGGECMFYVEAATYSAPSYDAMRENPDRCQQCCRETISDFDFDTLDTAQGVAQAEDDLLSALDELCQDLNGHSDHTIEAVTLTITHLTPESQMDGGIGEPEYP
jgi:hypothetical protein